MYFFVFATYVFYCFLIGIVWALNINNYNSDFNCNESKYCILELKMEFWHKKPFSICFVHKSRKLSNFEPTLDYIMLRNFGTVRPIFSENSAKSCARLERKKSWKLAARKKISTKLSRETSRGGRFPPPPPPPGPFRVKELSSWLFNVIHVKPPFHYHDLDPDLSSGERQKHSFFFLQGSFEFKSIIVAAMWGRGRSKQFFKSARKFEHVQNFSPIVPTRISPLIIVRPAG